MDCPRCGTSASRLVKEWDYSIYHVKRYDCEGCGEAFQAYFRDGEFSHTIPKRK